MIAVDESGLPFDDGRVDEVADTDRSQLAPQSEGLAPG